MFGSPLEKLMECDKRIFPHLRIPRIMEQAMEYLTMHGFGQEYVFLSLLASYLSFLPSLCDSTSLSRGLFRIGGSADEMKHLKNAWNTGQATDFLKVRLFSSLARQA